MRTIIGLVAFCWLICGSVYAQTDQPLFHIGATYSISTYRGAPPPFQTEAAASTLVAKIIRYGGSQWYGVEFDVVGAPQPNKPDTTMIFKNRMWLNFASMVNVIHIDEPDYATLYPKGFQVVPFKADNW
jgi:hypothetical protein